MSGASLCPTRLVPNPAKKKAHQQVLAARARYERALAATDAALLEAVSPPPRGSDVDRRRRLRDARVSKHGAKQQRLPRS